MTRLLLILHFTGLIMGFSATFANMVVMRLVGSATAQEAEVLRRVPPRMLRISAWGVLLLVVTGPMLVYSKYGGWGTLPWMFWVKMLGVAAVVVAMGFLHVTMAKLRRGDVSVAPQLRLYGLLTNGAAALTLVLAVIAFV